MADGEYKVIDLFAGAGGLTLGFHNTGKFESVFAVEFDEAAAATYAENFEHTVMRLPEGDEPVDVSQPHMVFNGDIRRLGQVKISADLVIGGPPCQGFSPLGKMSPREEHKDMNQLWQQYMRIVAQVRPKAFVIENVPQLLKSREAVAIKLMAEMLGYTVDQRVLKAVEYGVPQRRVRGFIIGLQGGVQPVFPRAGEEKATVRDAIGDLLDEPTVQQPEDIPGEKGVDMRQNLQIGRNPTPMSVERYKAVEQGENRFDLQRKRPDITPDCWLKKPTGSTDVFGRLRWDEPAYTIRTEFFKPEKGCYLHPEKHRPITHREAAKLQTFDDWFYFKGSKIQIARQIGNAVPPRLANALAMQILEQLPEVKAKLAEGWTPPDVDFESCLTEALMLAYSDTPLLDMTERQVSAAKEAGDNGEAEDELTA